MSQSESIILTPEATASLAKLHVLIPNVEPYFLLETALAITAALYEKAADGATIEVKMPDGKVEELRFKVKKPGKKKIRP